MKAIDKVPRQAAFNTMSEDKEYLAMMEAQRKAFEAQFGSLEDLGYEDKSKEIQQQASHESETDTDSNSDDNSSSRSSSSSDNEEEDEFKGFSEDEDVYASHSSDDSQEDSDIEEGQYEEEQEEAPVVVKFSDKTTPTSTIISSQSAKPNNKKLLRKGKIPSLLSIEYKQQMSQLEAEQEILKNGNSSKEEMENMQKDIELQRLLSESHILSATQSAHSYSGTDLTLRTINDDPFGKARAKTMTQRLRNLPTDLPMLSKALKLEKMPMQMRKGMLRKEVQRVKKFEQEAKNSGTILSKTKKYELRDLNMSRANKVGFKSDFIGKHVIGKKQLQNKTGFRQRGLQVQSIGKSTRNGLVINEKDLARITGGGGGKGKGKGKKGRR